MSANHHFVPRYHFRNFTGGADYISVFLKDRERAIHFAPIRGQCAKKDFYAKPEIESHFAVMEGKHADAIRRLIVFAETAERSLITEDVFVHLFAAVQFQRFRTLFEVQKRTQSREEFALTAFENYLKYEDEELYQHFIEARKLGQVSLKQSPTEMVLEQIDLALKTVSLICDLQPRLIINHTDYPFIFGDSPVVFYNSLYRNVKNRGVLGLQTPGLQIFMPVTPDLQVMLIDDKSYDGDFKRSIFCDVLNRADVSNLNALQLHHSANAIYFAAPVHEAYVKELYQTHKPLIVPPVTTNQYGGGWLIKGEPPKGETMLTFEKQVSHNLSLSFIECEPIAQEDFAHRKRDPEFYKEYKARQSDPNVAEGSNWAT